MIHQRVENLERTALHDAWCHQSAAVSRQPASVSKSHVNKVAYRQSLLAIEASTTNL